MAHGERSGHYAFTVHACILCMHGTTCCLALRCPVTICVARILSGFWPVAVAHGALATAGADEGHDTSRTMPEMPVASYACLHARVMGACNCTEGDAAILHFACAVCTLARFCPSGGDRGKFAQAEKAGGPGPRPCHPRVSLQSTTLSGARKGGATSYAAATFPRAHSTWPRVQPINATKRWQWIFFLLLPGREAHGVFRGRNATARVRPAFRSCQKKTRWDAKIGSKHEDTGKHNKEQGL
eukprot:gene7903-biopygen15121